MAITHTDTDISNLKINRFHSKEAYLAALAQNLIGMDEISFVENDSTQSDWNQSDPTKDDYIRNKPVVSNVVISTWSQI